MLPVFCVIPLVRRYRAEIVVRLPAGRLLGQSRWNNFTHILLFILLGWGHSIHYMEHHHTKNDDNILVWFFATKQVDQIGRGTTYGEEFRAGPRARTVSGSGLPLLLSAAVLDYRCT